MLISIRRLPSALPRRALRSSRSIPRYASTTARESDKIPTNDPNPPKSPPNVSESNAIPISMQGVKSGTLQETPEDGEAQRQMQAPNRKDVWSPSQQPRDRAMSGPRFEQTIMEYQVRLSMPPKNPRRREDEVGKCILTDLRAATTIRSH